MRLTFQNKVTLQDPGIDSTLLQTSGASEGAEMNREKPLGHDMYVEQYIPASHLANKVTMTNILEACFSLSIATLFMPH